MVFRPQNGTARGLDRELGIGDVSDAREVKLDTLISVILRHSPRHVPEGNLVSVMFVVSR